MDTFPYQPFLSYPSSPCPLQALATGAAGVTAGTGPSSSSSSSFHHDVGGEGCHDHQQIKEERRRNRKRGSGVRLSTDPQSVAARERRHRISDRFKILQSLVPGGSKMDTVSMLEEAIHYVKFLKAQIWLHQALMGGSPEESTTTAPPPAHLGSYAPSAVGSSGHVAAANALSSLLLPQQQHQHQQQQCFPYGLPSSASPFPGQQLCWPFQAEEEIFSQVPPVNYYHQ